MGIKGWFCAALMAAAGGNVFAAGSTCVPRAEMQTIAQHFNQFNTLAGADYCYDGSQTANLIQALEFMRTTKYASTMNNSTDELFSGTFAQDWWTYFIGRINDIQIQSSCPKGVGAFVYSFGNTMYVCPMLLTDSFAALDRTSVMMHEARHIDGFPHITCAHGPRTGLQGACDQQISDHGSYAVTVETYAQLAAYATDIHPALRAYAASSAVVYADEAFETPAHVDRQPNFLVLTNSKEFYRLPADGSSNLQRLGDAPALGHIVSRAQHLILYPDDKALPAKYIFSKNEGEIQQAAGDIAVEYNGQTPQQRAELVDVHIGAQWTVRVYHNHLLFVCDPTSPATQDVILSGQVAGSVLYPNGYDRAASSTFLITETGTLMEFGCKSRKAFVQAARMTLDQKYKRVQKLGQEVIGLTPDGRLFVINGAHSTPLKTSMDGRIYDLMPSQTFAFFASSTN